MLFFDVVVLYKKRFEFFMVFQIWTASYNTWYSDAATLL